MSYHINIIEAARANTFFRQVIFTGDRSQLVVMALQPGEDIGLETHAHVEQTLVFLNGSGVATLNGVSSPIVTGDAYVVTPGTEHNFTNTSDEVIKIYTIYAPPNHIAGKIHKTKADAVADIADEDFGEAVQ
ncbi:MAG: cupin domain-containing protein [Candidatus Magasanikbacteria bacterium]|nr:cupin domain-containing protein [Candidatus Magasanikbacteria bacterium]